MDAFTPEQVKEELGKLSLEWVDVDDKLIQHTFSFDDFDGAMKFVNQVAELANKADHHPDMHIHYNKVVIELWTHAADGLTEKDFELAGEIERL